MSSRRALSGKLAAWTLVVVAAAIYPFTVYLGLGAGSAVPTMLRFDWWAGLTPLAALEMSVVAALVLRRHPRHAVGWVAAAGGLGTSLSAFAGAYAGYSFSHARVLPAADFAVWLRGWLWYPASLLLLALLPALFPNGRLPSARWRPLIWAVAAGTLIQLLWVSLSELMVGYPRPDGPYPSGAEFIGGLVLMTGVFWVLSVGTALGAVATRFWRSAGVTRQQLKWFLAAVAVQAAVWAASFAASRFTGLSPYLNPYFDVLIPLTLLAMPVAIGIAILRHGLYDLDLVINRGLVYAGLAAFITLAYLVLVVGVGFAVGTGGRPNLPLSVLAMALVVVLVQPVRSRLQVLANRLVYGGPVDPHAVLGELSRTLAAGDVDNALAQLAQAVARGTGSRRARIRLRLPNATSRIAVWPAREGDEQFGRSVDVSYGGEIVGEIEADGSADQRLTDALVAQTGHALHTLRLSAELDARLAQLEAQAEELSASRTRLVQAQETERRRLERDLHDGIQQELVVLIAKARLARNQLERDPSLAGATLAELQSGAQHALHDLRSLARGIHPPVLSSKGLVPAVDAIAERMPIGIRVDAPPDVRDTRFAPEIEGAAYFVVAEGLANVLKHSGATEATVAINAKNSWLEVVISDDGRGFQHESTAQSGLRGLRDRVEALGGRVHITSGSGTRLEAFLPAQLNGAHD